MNSFIKILLVLLFMPFAVMSDSGTVHLVNNGNGVIQVMPTNEIILSGQSLDYHYNSEVETYFIVTENFNKACFSMDCTVKDDNRYTELDINDPYYYDVYPSEIVFFFNN